MKTFNNKILIVLLPILLIAGLGIGMTSVEFRGYVCRYTRICLDPIRPAPTWITHPSKIYRDGEMPQEPEKQSQQDRE